MKEICPHDKCTGCLACYNSCHKNAIKIVKDSCGFVYPEIDQSLCVDCGMCTRVCHINNKVLLHYPQDCYAATVNDGEELKTCSSGGAATELSRHIIKEGGVVYGCSGENIRDVHHIRIEDLEKLYSLKGSKYVQSDTKTVFKSVKKDLLDGRRVLFIGTPCQVAAVRNYIGSKNQENLLTVDLVCHGVPSQKMLNDNISLYSKDNEDISVLFRKKTPCSSICDAPWRITYGWFYKTSHMYALRGIKYYKDPYMLGFLSMLTLRQCCYKCRYATISRCGDFTLCDFWGLGKDSGFDIGKGVSAVLINTNKASSLWPEISLNVKSVKRDVVEAQLGNGRLQRPSPIHRYYDRFVQLYPEVGFEQAVKQCTKIDILKIFITKLKSVIR